MNTELENINLSNQRNNKGNSLIDIKTDYTIIDIETTGFDYKYNSIIEIGALKVRNNKIIEKFQTLVNSDCYINNYIEELTGITNDMINKAPKLNEILEKFLPFIGDDILVGHNINFDINFLYDVCFNKKSIYLTNDFIDTLRISKIINKDLKHHRISDLINLYNISFDNQHRALDDCINTFNIFIKMQENILEEYKSFELFKNDYENKRKNRYIHKPKIRSKDIVINCEDVDEDNPFFRKEVVFTGILEKMQRKDAMQIVINLGGKNRDTVTQETNYLVLGNNDYCKTLVDGKSSKQKKAEKYKLNGQDIEIISENVFYDMIKDYVG